MKRLIAFSTVLVLAGLSCKPEQEVGGVIDINVPNSSLSLVNEPNEVLEINENSPHFGIGTAPPPIDIEVGPHEDEYGVGTAPPIMQIFTQPVFVSIIIEGGKTAQKIDDNTVEITTTVPEKITKVQFNRAVLQTEFDHIPERKAKHQVEIEALDERAVEITKMLSVFE